MRVGTQTFAGLYQFTTNTLLEETAQAINEMGSGVIKFYLGPEVKRQSGITLTPSITNLLTLVRDEPIPSSGAGHAFPALRCVGLPIRKLVAL